jgi:hypothetical protein
MGKVLFEGYFGIKLRHDHLSIEPMLGKDRASIHIYQPANGLFVAYDYRFDEKEDKLSIKYNSNFPQEGELRILNPWIDLQKGMDDLRGKIEVQVDGREISFDIETKNDDSFIIIKTDFDNHTAIISVK